jgi:hypothetical protein
MASNMVLCLPLVVYFSLYSPIFTPLFSFNSVPLLDLGPWRQRFPYLLSLGRRPLDNIDESLEARVRSIANTLVHPTLTRRNSDALFGAQPRQRNADLARVARRHAVGDDVDVVAGVAQVERRLGDADVRLDADEGDLRGRDELGGDGRDEHGEAGLVVRRRGEQVGDGGDGWAELGRGLGGCYDGDGEGFGEVDEFLGGEDAGEGVRGLAVVVIVGDDDLWC